MAFIDPNIMCCAHVFRLQTTPVCDVKGKLGVVHSWHSTVPEQTLNVWKTSTVNNSFLLALYLKCRVSVEMEVFQSGVPFKVHHLFFTSMHETKITCTNNLLLDFVGIADAVWPLSRRILS